MLFLFVGFTNCLTSAFFTQKLWSFSCLGGRTLDLRLDLRPVALSIFTSYVDARVASVVITMEKTLAEYRANLQVEQAEIAKHSAVRGMSSSEGSGSFS